MMRRRLVYVWFGHWQSLLGSTAQRWATGYWWEPATDAVWSFDNGRWIRWFTDP